ncbi:MAG TPA: YkgJ family cysteine cluster protein [Gemmataceae bacterium]|jgi:Fe-S-cluster containining protein|nr:YkgJ family cysteine cluster protein [Gemmataceae bacterium]
MMKPARRDAGKSKAKSGPDPVGTEGLELDARRAQRVRSAELLRGGRTPLEVVAVAETAAELADQAMLKAVEQCPPRRPAACREGCAWCCHKVVGTAAPEVLRIAQWLRHSLSAEELHALRERVVRVDEQRKALRHDPWAAAHLACPLLDGERCSVYELRPLTCRGYNSSDAAACQRSVTARRRVEVPVYAPQNRLTTFVLDGMRAGLAEAGLHGDLLELTAALRIALAAPDVAERWLAREPVFAPARLP